MDQLALTRPEIDAERVCGLTDVAGRRWPFLEQLLDGPLDRRDLQDALDVSRSTSYKAVRELEEAGLVERTAGDYALTLKGRLLAAEHRRYLTVVESICRPESLLDLLPSDTEFDAAVLVGSDVRIADRHAPGMLVREIERIVTDATALKGTAPVVIPEYVELFREGIIERGLTADLVFAAPVLEHLFEVYREPFLAAFEGDLDVRRTEEELPFGLILVEEPSPTVAVVVYGPSGELAGLVENDSEATLSWARDRWTRYVTGSTEVTTTDV